MPPPKDLEKRKLYFQRLAASRAVKRAQGIFSKQKGVACPSRGRCAPSFETRSDRIRWTYGSLENALSKPGIYGSRFRLVLVAFGELEAKCYRCLREVWLDKPIPLDLEHINGDRNDNRK